MTTETTKNAVAPLAFFGACRDLHASSQGQPQTTAPTANAKYAEPALSTASPEITFFMYGAENRDQPMRAELKSHDAPIWIGLVT
jgi:hypothetical protein